MLEARGTGGNFYLHLTRWTVGDCLRFALRFASPNGCSTLARIAALIFVVV